MVHPGTQVGCTLSFDVASAGVDVALQITVARRPGLTIDDQLTIRSGDRALEPQEFTDPHGGRVHLVRAPEGLLTIGYAATVGRDASRAALLASGGQQGSPTGGSTSDQQGSPTGGSTHGQQGSPTGGSTHDQEGSPTGESPSGLERLRALQPSRYCPSDRLVGFAQRQFGSPGSSSPLDTVLAIRDFVGERTAYRAGASGPTTDAADTLLTAEGVCRDFAHLVAALCRAVEIPARVAAVYAPGLSPMDFHAVVETEIDGQWRVWDATGLAPRQSLVRIATGADAADTAFATVLGGTAELTEMEIVAVAGGDLPRDDHREPVTLG